VVDRDRFDGRRPMTANKIEREKIKDLPQGKTGKGNSTSRKPAPDLTAEELDKVAGGIVTHIPGNPV